MKSKLRFCFILFIFITCFLFNSVTFAFAAPANSAASANPSEAWILLSDYHEGLAIGDTYQIYAFASGTSAVSWKSADSKIASVNTYGLVTAKKAGSVKITAKIKNAEASCVITIAKTTITLNKTRMTLEHGDTAQLSAVTSNHSTPTYKSNKSSVAAVDENGLITAVKPGEAIITIKADGTTASCKVTVKQPTIKLSKSKITMYRGQSVQISATVSSNIMPAWKSNKSSVAVVDSNGKVIAVKHGTAVISVRVDGTTKTCEITVKQPSVKLNYSSLQLTTGQTAQLKATVSSGNAVTWSSSNSKVATVSSTGQIKTVKKGSATIYAKEDGVKVSCKIKVTEA